MNRIVKNWHLFVWLGAFLFFSLQGVAFAQESHEDAAKKHGVTFPIAELGGCTNYSSCRTYCEDPVNSNTCINFAKKKGFYKEERTAQAPPDFWARTRDELGCDSESSCRQLCEREANFDRCSAFAKKNNLGGGHTEDPSKSQILEKAKTTLGCDSPTTCRALCEKEANRQKCSDFAKEVGLRGGEQHTGPGGCTSEETCRAFCSDPDNYKICAGFSQASGAKFSGPGGCNSEESCRQYCQAHSQECEHVGGGQTYNPAEMCSKTPNCSWTGSTCQCSSSGGSGDYEKYCQENPDKCPKITGGVNPTYYYTTPPPGISAYPTYGSGGTYQYQTGGTQYDQATQCAKTTGCSWTGSTCQCQSTSGSGGSTAAPTSGGSSYDPASECTKQSGCSWTGSSCQCSSSSGSSGGTSNPSSGGSSSPDPATACAQTSGCSWTGSTCQCQAVHGAATQKGILETIWEYFFGR